MTVMEVRSCAVGPWPMNAYALACPETGVSVLLAGIELVELAGVSVLDPAQIAVDLMAFHQAQSDGLVLSWDVWHIPIERLDLVRSVWFPGS